MAFVFCPEHTASCSPKENVSHFDDDREAGSERSKQPTYGPLVGACPHVTLSQGLFRRSYFILQKLIRVMIYSVLHLFI